MKGKEENASISVTLDRVEGDFAVLIIDNQPFNLPVSLLPTGYQEGMSYLLTLVTDPDQSDILQSDIERLQSHFIRRTPGKDDTHSR